MKSINPSLHTVNHPGVLLFATLVLATIILSPWCLITIGVHFLMLWALLKIGCFPRETYGITVTSYLFYALVALMLLATQKASLPAWEGLSGPEGGIGTDDTFYYTQATDDFDPSRNGALKAVVKPLHNYSRFLRGVVHVTSYFKNPELIDLLLINSLILSFVPALCLRTARLILPASSDRHHKLIMKSVFLLTLLHPSLWSDGLVLIRDGLTATFFMAALLSVLKGAPFSYLAIAVILAYFRVSSALTLVVCSTPLLLPVMRKRYPKYALLVVTVFALTALFLLGFAYISGYVEQKGISFLREDYVEGFIARSADKKDSVSILYSISNLPAPLRIPSSFAFFHTAPFISLQLVRDGVFVPRLALGCLVGFLNIFFLGYWTRSFFISYRERNLPVANLMWRIHLVYLAGIFMVSTFSLQMRHKTMLLPVFCILVAHGLSVTDASARRMGKLFMLALASVNLAALLLR